MPAEMLTYAPITDRLGFWSAFQAFVNQLRLPRQHRHNGNALAADDLAERPTVTARSLEGEQSAVATLTARIETLEAELAKLEATAAVHRADFERERERFDRERERCEQLMADGLKTTAELMAAREATARIAGEFEAFKARPWWRRLVG
jgi:molecular chaperone GrpE (heat shock protein)